MSIKLTDEQKLAMFGGICWVGESVIHEGVVKSVMDTDMLNGVAKIGCADTNGIVWEALWVPWDLICKPN
jgi:hypothetical protein